MELLVALDPELATLAALIDGVPETVTGGAEHGHAEMTTRKTKHG